MKRFSQMFGLLAIMGLFALGCESITDSYTAIETEAPGTSSSQMIGTMSSHNVIVNENNVGDDWHENTAAEGTVAFVTDYGAPAGFGQGALELVTSSENPSRAQLYSEQDQGIALSTIDDVSYWTFVSSDSEGSALHAPSINIAIFADGVGQWTTLVFEPIYTHGNDAIARGQWQEWDASGDALWWSTRDIPGVCANNCRVSFDDIKAANPDAEIDLYALNLGTWNPNIVAAVDGFTVGEKTFNFEPVSNPETREDCMNGGWQDYGFRNQGQCIQFVNTGRDSR